MKFSTREEMNAPIGTVWAAVTNARAFERRAKRKGVEVQRLTDDAMGLGSGWIAQFDFRGVKREMETVVTGFEAPRLLEMDANVGGLDGFLTVELVELSTDLTQMSLVLDVRAKTLTARMLVQPMKLARGRIERRFKRRVGKFARKISKRG